MKKLISAKDIEISRIEGKVKARAEMYSYSTCYTLAVYWPGEEYPKVNSGKEKYIKKLYNSLKRWER